MQPCNLKGGGAVCCAAASRQGANSMSMDRGQLQEERKTMRRWYKVSGPPGGITGPPSMLFDRQRIMGDAIAPHAARSRMDGQSLKGVHECSSPGTIRMDGQRSPRMD